MKCNRKYDCEDGSDETTCDYFKNSQKQQVEDNSVNSQGHNQQQENHQNHNQHNQHSQHHSQGQGHPAITREQYEQQLRDRERQLAQREEQEARREAEERRREEEERRREEEERRREEEYRRQQQSAASNSISDQPRHEIVFKEEYDDASCLSHEFMCHTGECIDKRRVCDTRSDCLDGSDEKDCHNGQPSDRTEGRHDLPPAPPVIEDDWPEDLDESVSEEQPQIQPTRPPHHHQQQPQQSQQPQQPQHPQHPQHPQQPQQSHQHHQHKQGGLCFLWTHKNDNGCLCYL